MTPVSQTNILEVKKIYASYGIVPAIIDVSLYVKEREIVTLLGVNGAGKTSTLNAIYSILPISSGEIYSCGHTIHSVAPQNLLGLGICYVPEREKVFDPMSVMDNLILGSYSRRRKGEKEKIERDLTTVFNIFPVLEKYRKRFAGVLSGGERQMLALGRALMSSPRLLLLDEPSLGLAPLIITHLMRLIADMRERGLSVLLVEQNARAALKIADRGYVLESGKITIRATTQELLSNEMVRAAYLSGRIR
jgi:branched-chain amino acid transport system ATP-binding protein